MSVDVGLPAAAIAATVAVLVHGGVGHRWLMQQLRGVELPPSSLFGDADVGLRVFVMTWHAVTAVFAVSAGALYLLAFTDGTSRELLLFLSALHGVLLVLGLAVFARRLDAMLRRPIPPVFAACMTTVAVATALAAR